MDACRDATAEADELSAQQMAVLCTFREPSLCRQVHCEFMRNAVLDLTPIIPATACHQRNYVERYSRYIISLPNHVGTMHAHDALCYSVTSDVGHCRKPEDHKRSTVCFGHVCCAGHPYEGLSSLPFWKAIVAC